MDDSIKNKTISSLVWKLLERGGNAVIALIVQIVMARLLAPEQFGMLAIMLVFVNVGCIISISGLGTALVQASDVTDDDFSTVFWMCLGVSILLYAAIFFAAPMISAFYDSPGLVMPLRTIALVIIPSLTPPNGS